MSITNGTGDATIQLKSGTSVTVLTQHQDISGKADKVSGGTENNFFAIDANGNLKDSGKGASDFDASGAAAQAETNAKNYADGLASNYDAAGAASTAKSEVIGTSQDDKTANTIYGAKAFATDADKESAYFEQNFAVIAALSEDPNAATTTVTTNPEWKIVYTDNEDRILVGKRQDNTWYFAADLDIIIDTIIGGYVNP